MSYAKKTYLVELSHPTFPKLNQVLESIEVYLHDDGMRHCRANKMGCSRNYVADGDRKAINLFVAEHGAKALSIAPAYSGDCSCDDSDCQTCYPTIHEPDCHTNPCQCRGRLVNGKATSVNPTSQASYSDIVRDGMSE